MKIGHDELSQVMKAAQEDNTTLDTKGIMAALFAIASILVDIRKSLEEGH